MFINKVLSEHSHAHSLIFHAIVAELNSYTRDHRAHKAYFILWSHTEKVGDPCYAVIREYL